MRVRLAACTRLPFVGATLTGRISEADRLIIEAATGARRLSRIELRRAITHVAQAGFDPDARQRVAGPLVGLRWQGRVLKRGEELPTADAHYLKHVVAQGEWPDGTTFENYVDSLRQVICDPASGLLVSRFREKGWQLAVVRRSGPLRGSAGYDWVMVEYRLATGHWMTAFQLVEGVEHFANPVRRDRRWLRKPKSCRVLTACCE